MSIKKNKRCNLDSNIYDVITSNKYNVMQYIVISKNNLKNNTLSISYNVSIFSDNKLYLKLIKQSNTNFTN